jgi:hypothetical protein
MGDAELYDLFSVAASTAAVITTVISAYALTRHSKSQQPSVFLEFSKWHNSSQIEEALFGLISFLRDNPNDFAEKFASEFVVDRLGPARELDIHRRAINRYFVGIADLYTAKLIDIRLARILTNVSALNVYNQIVVPMNDAKYGKSDHYPKIIARIRKQYASGDLFKRY